MAIEKSVLKSLFQSLLNWSAVSNEKLESAENVILSNLKTPWRGFYVDIVTNDGEPCKVWTIAMNEQSLETPLLFVHGLGAGSALWILNLDEQAKIRPVYVIDVPGFGKSSRIPFSDDPILVEQKFVEIIEKWRSLVDLPKINICGHSMGGFIAFSYAISHSERLQHLILADPWGLSEKPLDGKPNKHTILADKLGKQFSKFVNPLGVLRFAGPFGQWVIECTHGHMLTCLESNKEFDLKRDCISQYLNQINLQRPTGEAAFKVLMDEFYWAKNPRIKRIDELRDALPITLILAEKSWVDNIDEDLFKKSRSNSYVNYHMIKNVGHELFAYNSNEFNCIVKTACAFKE